MESTRKLDVTCLIREYFRGNHKTISLVTKLFLLLMFVKLRMKGHSCCPPLRFALKAVDVFICLSCFSCALVYLGVTSVVITYFCQIILGAIVREY